MPNVTDHDTSLQGRTDWLELRRTGIGGSDAGTVMGVNKYQTPQQLWMEKVHGYAADRDEFTIGGSSEAAYHGTQLEGYVGECFTVVTGKDILPASTMRFTDQYGYPMYGNLDFDLPDEPHALLECKTAGAHMAKLWANDSVPEPYLYQVLHYLTVFERDLAYVAVLLGGQKFEYRTIDRTDYEWEIEALLEAERDFWACVLNGTPPALEAK